MWQVYGQDHVLRQLEASLKQGRLAHAYLLEGPPHVGKMTLALNLAQGLNCSQGPGIPCGECPQCGRIARGQHADVRVVSVGRGQDGGPGHPDSLEGPRRSRGTVIGIDAIKEVLHRASLKPYEGAYGVTIFDGAEAMSEDAANALLKTLEEPHPGAVFLLLTADSEALLPTIWSRCRHLQLRPMAQPALAEKLVLEHRVDPGEAKLLARLARGCPGWTISALRGPELLDRRTAQLGELQETCQAGLEGRFSYASQLADLFFRDREALRLTLNLWLTWWRDVMLIKEGGEAYIDNIDRLSELRLHGSGLTTAGVVAFVRRLLDTLEALERNANPRLALEVLMLNLPSAEAGL